MKILTAAAVFAVLTTTAQAATVASGATSADNSGGITLDGSGTTILSNNRAYNSTNIGADWVWDTDATEVDSASFSFTFDLSGFDVATAVISGLWGVDNYGSILLNGIEISSLTDYIVGNFAWNNVYGTSDSSLFNDGLNTVSYLVDDEDGQAAFRATILVEADEMPADQIGEAITEMPIPAGSFLLVSGLGLLALRRRFG